jgi:hypothetical protein
LGLIREVGNAIQAFLQCVINGSGNIQKKGLAVIFDRIPRKKLEQKALCERC